jgi:hypothetical protein
LAERAGGRSRSHRYGATLLVALTGDPVEVLGADARPIRVQFQASAFSPVDDLLVTGRTPEGGERRASVGVRHAPHLTTSDKASVPLIATYLRVVTESWSEVTAGRWRLALAVASPNPAARQVRELTVIARANPTEAGFRADVARPTRTSQDVRDRLIHLDALVKVGLENEKNNIRPGATSAAELTWRLLRSLLVPELRLEDGDTTDRVNAVSQLRPLTRDQSAASAADLFSRLASLVSDYARRAPTSPSPRCGRTCPGHHWPGARPTGRRGKSWTVSPSG